MSQTAKSAASCVRSQPSSNSSFKIQNLKSNIFFVLSRFCHTKSLGKAELIAIFALEDFSMNPIATRCHLPKSAEATRLRVHSAFQFSAFQHFSFYPAPFSPPSGPALVFQRASPGMSNFLTVI
ncbi:MAG: hypothetical protein WCP35_06145 [Verrucomicrobiota bacterium]